MYNLPGNKSLVDLGVPEKVVLICGHPEKPQPLSQGDQRGMRSLGFWISEIAFHGGGCCCHAQCFHSALCALGIYAVIATLTFAAIWM